MAGINSARGAAVEVLGKLVGGDPTRISRVLPAIERAVHDPHAGVRACAAVATTFLIDREPDTAATLAVELLGPWGGGARWRLHRSSAWSTGCCGRIWASCSRCWRSRAFV